MPIRYAGFWRRFTSMMIDAACVALALWVIEMGLLGILYWLGRLRGQDLPFVEPFALQLFIVVGWALVGLPYFVFFHVRYGATPGKRLLGVRVRSRADHGPVTSQQAVLRYAAFCLSWIFPATFVAAAVHPEKRGLHDRLAGTIAERIG